MPNHVHLVLRRGEEGLSGFMRRLLTGYATGFNRRYGRVGHLVQNRFRSELVDEERYFLEVLRYVHLNPIRAELVRNLEELDCYPWSGHARLVGRIDDGWQEVGFVLAQFGATATEARRAYRDFLAAQLPEPEPEFPQVGVTPGPEDWQVTPRLRRGREAWANSERVLGSREFAEQLRQALERDRPATAADGTFARQLFRRILEALRRRDEELGPGTAGRRTVSLAARAVASYLAVRHAGLPQRAIAAAFDVSPPTVVRDVRAGARLLARVGLRPEQFMPAPLPHGPRARSKAELLKTS